MLVVSSVTFNPVFANFVPVCAAVFAAVVDGFVAVIATFVAVFPMENPKYVLVVTLDEPEDRNMDRPVRTAGRTAVPVAREIINRIATK